MAVVVCFGRGLVSWIAYGEDEEQESVGENRVEQFGARDGNRWNIIGNPYINVCCINIHINSQSI